MVPFNMEGQILIPLNKMRESNPKLYEAHASKYEGRQELMDEIVPKLNCKWNDVLHFSPINPDIVFQCLLKTGHSPNTEAKFFKVPLTKFKEDQTVIFKYTRDDAEMTEEEIEFLDISKFWPLEELNIATLEWYKRCNEKGQRPLLFHRVPHILTLGNIDISDCEIVGWKA